MVRSSAGFLGWLGIGKAAGGIAALFGGGAAAGGAAAGGTVAGIGALPMVLIAGAIAAAIFALLYNLSPDFEKWFDENHFLTSAERCGKFGSHSTMI